MAKVKDQSIPTDQFEETLDPPIDFKDQYRRALGEGIDHPKLPAGEEIVTFSKKESRPAQRSDWKYFKKPKAKEHRRAFQDCAMCWHNQYFFDFQVNPCHSAGSRHYFEDWTWIPGAKNTAYNKFMQDCLNYEAAHPGVPFPRCQDIKIYPSAIYFCPGDEITFTLGNAVYPVTIWAAVGTCGPGLKWTAPPTWGECPSTVEVDFEDSEGRKGCYELIRKPQNECCNCEGAELEIIYTTLVMAFREEQTLSIDPAKQGCPPYVWGLTGPGSLIPSGNNLTALFIAPEENPGCQNSVIQLTDGCDLVAEIQIRTSCTGEKYVYNWVYAYSSSCGIYTSQHYYVYTKLYDCFTGDLIDEWFETEFTVFGSIPTTPTTLFCCEEGDGLECYEGCGLTFTTPYCSGCEEKYCWEDEGCCPP